MCYFSFKGILFFHISLSNIWSLHCTGSSKNVNLNFLRLSYIFIVQNLTFISFSLWKKYLKRLQWKWNFLSFCTLFCYKVCNVWWQTDALCRGTTKINGLEEKEMVTSFEFSRPLPTFSKVNKLIPTCIPKRVTRNKTENAVKENDLYIW